MFIHDKKNALMTIMARRDGKGERTMAPAPMKMEEVRDEGGGEADPRHLAAQDMMSAMHEKSPEKLMHAMGHFVDMHMNKASEPEPKE